MTEQDWRDERRRLQRQLVEVEFQRLAARARVTGLERDLAGERARVQQLEAELHRLQVETAAMRGSRSWKVTGPLRAATQALNRTR